MKPSVHPTWKAVVAAGAVLAACVAARAGVHADAPLAHRAMAADVGQDLPGGPGKDVVVRLCEGCHDLMFTMSTRETEEGWARIVNDMRARGTDGTEAEFAQVIAYLTTHMGKAEPKGHVELDLLASRTKVAPGEHFALGIRLVAADGWHLKGGVGIGRAPQVSWTTPAAVVVRDAASPASGEPTALLVFPAVVSATAAPGASLDLTARVAYEICRETCVTETATTSLTLPVGVDGTPAHQDEFARAGVTVESPH